MGADSEKRRKARLKKVYHGWLLVSLALALIVLILLLYKPAGYNPTNVIQNRQVSPYLTHELLPELYNGAQLQKPFELCVRQDGINDAISRSKWPKEASGTKFSAPAVLFAPGRIVLMGTTDIKGAKLVVTIVVKPALNEDGLLELPVTKVKIGAMNVTFPAKMMARRMYLERLAEMDTDKRNWRGQIAAALLNNEPFEPVFEIDDKKVRLRKITISRGKLTIHLVPASEQTRH